MKVEVVLMPEERQERNAHRFLMPKAWASSLLVVMPGRAPYESRHDFTWLSDLRGRYLVWWIYDKMAYVLPRVDEYKDIN